MSARSGFEMVGRGISSQDLYRSRDGSCEFSARLLVSHVRGKGQKSAANFMTLVSRAEDRLTRS